MIFSRASSTFPTIEGLRVEDVGFGFPQGAAHWFSTVEGTSLQREQSVHRRSRASLLLHRSAGGLETEKGSFQSRFLGFWALFSTWGDCRVPFWKRTTAYESMILRISLVASSSVDPGVKRIFSCIQIQLFQVSGFGLWVSGFGLRAVRLMPYLDRTETPLFKTIGLNDESKTHL